MSTYIEAVVSRMFERHEPWNVSNSVANLGPNAARLTWANALNIAGESGRWLLSDLGAAVAGMREWARSTGAWDDSEVASLSDLDCLALFAQCIAGELRMLGSDDWDLDQCLSQYLHTDWDAEPEYPIGVYRRIGTDGVAVVWYTGS